MGVQKTVKLTQTRTQVPVLLECRFALRFHNLLMTQTIYNSLKTALVGATLGTTVFSGGFYHKAMAQEIRGNGIHLTQGLEVATAKAESSPDLTTSTTSSDPSNGLNDISLLNVPSSLDNSDKTARTYSFVEDNVPATILYIKNIPVLTFLSRNGENQEEEAQSIADRINQTDFSQITADQITVSWDTQNQTYTIRIGETPLVSFNNRIILPDTTENPAQDALQATNRLRRLLGNAEPLTKIANKPKEITLSPNSVAPDWDNARVISQLRGMASWYGPGFHGRSSANGERFNQYAMTAAHKSLPFGTRVRVTNLNNGLSVVVRINDRGPYVRSRVIDLSAGAAQQIGMMSTGTAPVKLEILGL